MLIRKQGPQMLSVEILRQPTKQLKLFQNVFILKLTEPQPLRFSELKIQVKEI